MQHRLIKRYIVGRRPDVRHFLYMGGRRRGLLVRPVIAK